jgi:hypothetical protein
VTIVNKELSGGKQSYCSHPLRKRLTLLSFLLAVIVLGASSALAQAPIISSFSPTSGPHGTLVTITGSNFGNAISLSIGGASAIVVSNTGTQLVGYVMPASTTGAISIVTGGGSSTSAGNFAVTKTPYPRIQQGAKLVGSKPMGSASQGYSVAISADGNTALVGGIADSLQIGAAWVYTRSGGMWSQQGNKLVGTGGAGKSSQGTSVALSADGNTAIVGGNGDNNALGAAWIFTRSAGIWTQQGNKLVGTGATGYSTIGDAVSLSADGNTALVGGGSDGNMIGATWVFIRSGGQWSQQGSKLVGTGAIGTANQGRSVSISADGNTAIIGGSLDNSNVGAAWIFARSGGIWSQQGNKLVGTGNAGKSSQGWVSMAADGNTAILGGTGDSSGVGAVWIFTRSGGVWSQQGNKLVGTGATGIPGQGYTLAISGDGNTLVVGGTFDNNQVGAVWVFNRSAGQWSQQGNKLIGTGASGAATQGKVALSSDGSTLLVGGSNDANSTGAAWVFVASSDADVPNFQKDSSLVAYPNPNTGTFTILSTQEGAYSIVNLLGQTIQQFWLTNSNNYTCRLEGLNSGVYLIIGFNNNLLESKKIVVTK